jgi:D-lactate dehydrogenase
VAILHRFAAAGAIGRFFSLYKNKLGPMMTIDVALRRNERDWLETLPEEIEEQIECKYYYGHFFCHVNHQNYIMKKGVNAKEIKNRILASFDDRGAEYPAEHNVGHEYCAKPVLRDFYKELDPSNTFNPGIGQTSKLKNWQ